MPFKDPKRKRAYNTHYQREVWYPRHREQHIELSRKRVVKYRPELRKWLDTKKSTLSCIFCAESDPRCLDFHHNNPKVKSFNIASVLGRGYSIKRIEEEISKCSVLCSNCHRKLHR